MHKHNLLIGLASALGVIFIWSGFIVFSRAGVITSLTAYDITALRFMVAGLIVLPFAHAWWPGHLPLHAKIVMMFCGPGAVYSILMYLGLSETSAAYAGVFANGSLPLWTMLVAVLVAHERPTRGQLGAILLILLGGILLGYPGLTAGHDNLLSGILLFLTASAVLAVYIFGISRWQLAPRQALALVNLPNAVIYLPLWYVLLPSGLADADQATIVFQALFQGLGPGFLAVILFTLAATHLGPTPTAAFSASVPASAAVLAIPVLSEVPAPIEWTGIAVVTLGLVLLVGLRRR